MSEVETGVYRQREGVIQRVREEERDLRTEALLSESQHPADPKLEGKWRPGWTHNWQRWRWKSV